MLVISLRDALLAKKKASPRPQPPAVIQYEDNSVHIGNGNKISNSTIGQKTLLWLSAKYPIPHLKKKNWRPNFSGKY